MIVRSFKVSGLFGIIDADLKLKSDLSVIIGRNAAGKTSVLTLLANFMHLDIDAVKTMAFKSAVVNVVHDAQSITIEAANEPDNAYILMKWGDKTVKTLLLNDTVPRGSRRLYSASTIAFYDVSTASG